MVSEAINSRESSLRTQSDVDTAYDDWCELLQKQCIITPVSNYFVWGSLRKLLRVDLVNSVNLYYINVL